MFSMSVPWWEFVVRGVAVYLFLLVFLRLTGRRQTGQYAPFDLVLLLILSNAVQNSMNAGDNSLIGGMVSASTLILCHLLLSWLTFRFPALDRLIDGKAKALIRDGHLNKDLMRDRKSTRLNSSHLVISYAVFCLKKKTEAIRTGARGRLRATGDLPGPGGTVPPPRRPASRAPLARRALPLPRHTRSTRTLPTPPP